MFADTAMQSEAIFILGRRQDQVCLLLLELIKYCRIHFFAQCYSFGVKLVLCNVIYEIFRNKISTWHPDLKFDILFTRVASRSLVIDLIFYKFWFHAIMFFSEVYSYITWLRDRFVAHGTSISTIWV